MSSSRRAFSVKTYTAQPQCDNRRQAEQFLAGQTVPVLPKCRIAGKQNKAKHGRTAVSRNSLSRPTDVTYCSVGMRHSTRQCQPQRLCCRLHRLLHLATPDCGRCPTNDIQTKEREQEDRTTSQNGNSGNKESEKQSKAEKKSQER